MGIAESIETKLSLISSLTRKFILESDCKLDEIVKHLPGNLTGADFYALCSDAMSRAIDRKINEFQFEIDEWNKTEHTGHPFPTSTTYYLDHIVTKDRLEVKVSHQDFLEAASALEPSVSDMELARYAKIREQFEPERSLKESKQEQIVPKMNGKGKEKV